MPRFPTITDLTREILAVRAGRYGVIQAASGRFVSLTFRPWPKYVLLPEQKFLGTWLHRRRVEDHCRLYFDQPRSCPHFLALKYIQSGRGTTLATLRAALAALDEVARIKRTDALLCDVANARISDRLMQRLGWQPHAPSLFHRNHIRRFYGEYPLHQVGSADAAVAPAPESLAI